jgi:hypothetical protein
MRTSPVSTTDRRISSAAWHHRRIMPFRSQAEADLGTAGREFD